MISNAGPKNGGAAINSNERPNIAQWGCLVMLLGTVILTIVGGVWLFTRKPRPADELVPTAIVWTTTPTPRSPAFPTTTPTPNAAGAIAIGMRAQVTGTGEVGLSIRSEAGTNAERLAVAKEGEILLVAGGPKQADEYTWWFVRDELNAQREGWVVEDYLRPTE